MRKSKTSSEKFECRNIWISWKIYKILKTVEFFNMWLFISKIKNLNFCICQKTHFCCSGLGQVSSWWISSNFCVVIWRCHLILTFSGLHFFFYKYPMNFQQGLVQPPLEQKWSKRITVQCLGNFDVFVLVWVNLILTFLFFQQECCEEELIII